MIFSSICIALGRVCLLLMRLLLPHLPCLSPCSIAAHLAHSPLLAHPFFTCHVFGPLVVHLICSPHFPHVMQLGPSAPMHLIPCCPNLQVLINNITAGSRCIHPCRPRFAWPACWQPSTGPSRRDASEGRSKGGREGGSERETPGRQGGAESMGSRGGQEGYSIWVRRRGTGKQATEVQGEGRQ